jgi:ribonuclease BN (tRNA processing enzyme)
MKQNNSNAELFIQLLGTGTIFSDENHSCASTLLRYRFANILVDIGPGTFDKLKQAEVAPEDLNYIFVTHFHPDHISDLVPLLLYYYLKAPDKSKEEIQVWGPPGLNNFILKMREAFGDWLNPDKRIFKIRELVQPTYKFPEFQLSWEKVVHNEESIGLRFTFDEKVIAFSGDSEYCHALVNLCRNATLAFLECSFPDRNPKSGHLTPGGVAKIARQAKVQKVVLTHLYPETFKVDPVRQIKKEFDGTVGIGKDLQIISLK